MFQILNLIFGIYLWRALAALYTAYDRRQSSRRLCAVDISGFQYLYGAFRFIFPTAAGGSVFDWSILVAIAGYYLLFYLLKQLVIVLYTADTANQLAATGIYSVIQGTIAYLLA